MYKRRNEVRKVKAMELDLVIELALEFPVTKIELASSSTAETRPVRTPPVRKRPAEFAMSATKNSRYETRDFSSQHPHDSYLPSLQNYPSHTNAQIPDELGHRELPRPVLLPYTNGPKRQMSGELAIESAPRR